MKGAEIGVIGRESANFMLISDQEIGPPVPTLHTLLSAFPQYMGGNSP